MKILKSIRRLLASSATVAAIYISTGIPVNAAAPANPGGSDSLYRLYSGNLREYPYSSSMAPGQTPAPAGYTPFHIEHYGRHGSRWLIGPGDYRRPVERLERAERNGQLTPLGEKTLAALREISNASTKREGELSDKGHLQHRGIGRRMAENFPEIFTDGANVDAKSTVVIRCILSMLNGIEGIKDVAPGVNVRADASEAEMYYMNFDDRNAWKYQDRADSIYGRPFRRAHTLKGDYLTRLVKDEQFARDSVEPGLMPYLYWVLANTQSHTGQPWLVPEVFSVDEMKDEWLSDSGWWLIHSINSPMTEGRMPYVQRNLLRNMIESADTALVSKTPGANLRYGHDSIVISLVTLLNLNGYGNEYATLDDAFNAGVNTYDIIPMGANVQMVFYRPDNEADGWLVRVLLNEREATLPIPGFSGPYYPWKAVRQYYLDLLSDLNKKFGE